MPAEPSAVFRSVQRPQSGAAVWTARKDTFCREMNHVQK